MPGSKYVSYVQFNLGVGSSSTSSTGRRRSLQSGTIVGDVADDLRNGTGLPINDSVVQALRNATLMRFNVSTDTVINASAFLTTELKALMELLIADAIDFLNEGQVTVSANADGTINTKIEAECSDFADLKSSTRSSRTSPRASEAPSMRPTTPANSK